MRTNLVLARRLNYRVIELEDGTKDQTIGVLKRDGEIQYLPWRGFVDRNVARNDLDGLPVKLVVYRVGIRSDYGTQWTDVQPGDYVQGLVRDMTAFAVVDTDVRIIGLSDG